MLAALQHLKEDDGAIEDMVTGMEDVFDPPVVGVGLLPIAVRDVNRIGEGHQELVRRWRGNDTSWAVQGDADIGNCNVRVEGHLFPPLLKAGILVGVSSRIYVTLPGKDGIVAALLPLLHRGALFGHRLGVPQHGKDLDFYQAEQAYQAGGELYDSSGHVDAGWGDGSVVHLDRKRNLYSLYGYVDGSKEDAANANLHLPGTPEQAAPHVTLIIRDGGVTGKLLVETEVDDGLADKACKEPQVCHAGVEEYVLGEEEYGLQAANVVCGDVGNVLHGLSYERVGQGIRLLLLGAGSRGQRDGHDDADDVSVARGVLSRGRWSIDGGEGGRHIVAVVDGVLGDDAVKVIGEQAARRLQVDAGGLRVDDGPGMVFVQVGWAYRAFPGRELGTLDDAAKNGAHLGDAQEGGRDVAHGLVHEGIGIGGPGGAPPGKSIRLVGGGRRGKSSTGADWHAQSRRAGRAGQAGNVHFQKGSDAPRGLLLGRRVEADAGHGGIDAAGACRHLAITLWSG